jgi:hypothetical protein
LPSSPLQPATPIAASASIAINGTRDRVKPWAPANFMVDSLEDERILRWEPAVLLQRSKFGRDLTDG